MKDLESSLRFLIMSMQVDLPYDHVFPICLTLCELKPHKNSCNVPKYASSSASKFSAKHVFEMNFQFTRRVTSAF